MSDLHQRNADYNTHLRVVTDNIPINLNRPMFSHLSTSVTRTVVDVGTIGNIRINSNVTITKRFNRHSHSRLAPSNFATGRTNNVLNNVSSNRGVQIDVTLGPASDVAATNGDVGARNRSISVLAGNHRSPYINIHTAPVTRTVLTVILLSRCLHRHNRGTSMGPPMRSVA